MRILRLLIATTLMASCHRAGERWVGDYELVGFPSTMPGLLDRMPGRRMEIVSSTFTLTGDGRFRGVEVVRFTWHTGEVVDSTREMTHEDSGTFVSSGNTLRLTEPSGRTSSFELQKDGRLTGCGLPHKVGVAVCYPFVYRKR
jgi:hypothetical protein